MDGDVFRADSRFALIQWETLLQNNTISHWVGTNLESALYFCVLLFLFWIKHNQTLQEKYN